MQLQPPKTWWVFDRFPFPGNIFSSPLFSWCRSIWRLRTGLVWLFHVFLLFHSCLPFWYWVTSHGQCGCELVPLPRPVGEKHHRVRSWNSNQHIEHMIFHMLRFQNSRFINHHLKRPSFFSKSEHIWTMSTTVCLYYLWLTCDDTFQWHAHIGHHLSPSDATWVASFVHPILRFPCRFASEPADRWSDLGYPTRNRARLGPNSKG